MRVHAGGLPRLWRISERARHEMAIARRDQRKNLLVQDRLSFLDDDADEHEEQLNVLVKRLDQELKSLRQILMGLMVTIAASALGTMVTLVLTGRS